MLTSSMYDSCKTIQELENTFKDWAYNRSIAKFANDYKVSGDKVQEEYKKHITTTPKEFLIMSTSEGNFFYYVGVDKEFKKEIQQAKKTMDAKKQGIRIRDAEKDIQRNVDTFNGHVHDALNGKYDYDKETRDDLKKLSKTLEDKSVSEKDKKDAIDAINAKYKLNIPSDATAKEINSMDHKTTGGFLSDIGESLNLSGIGDSISLSWKELTNGNYSEYFDKSQNKYVKAFTDQGISGDILWGVITGKYNKDHNAKEALLKFSEDLNSGKLSPEEKERRLKELNDTYKLNLSPDVTPDEINDIIKSNQEMNYKRKVSDIARGLIEQKINEEVANQLDKKLGPIFRQFGIKFTFKDRNIIQDLRDIIRGTKKIEFEQEKFLKQLKEGLEKKINKLIEDKVYKVIDDYTRKANEQIDKYAKKINDQIDVYRKKVDAVSDKLESWIKNPESFKLIIANKLDSWCKQPIDNIANKLDSLDKPLEKIGLGGLGLGNMFRQISGVFLKGVAERIKTAAQPILKKALEITKKISEAMKRAMEAVNKLKEQAKALVQKWANALKDAIAQHTKKLINEIVKFVRLKISGYTGADGITRLRI